jgi:preprotein translocase subunit SecA
MMRDAIADAVDKFITQDFVAATIAEWGRVNFDAVIDPADLQGMRSIQELEHFIKDKSRLEAETTITASLAEFTGEDPDDPASWDIKGLAEWAKTRFQVTLSPSRIRNMTVDEVDEQLRAAALEQIDKRDCAGLMKYLDPNYAEQELSGWAEKKFGIQIAPMQFITDAKSNARLPAEDICEMIEKRARDAYARREIEYPVTQVLNFAYGSPGAAPDNPYSAEYVRQWGNLKFRNGWTIETVRALGVEGVRRELVKEQEAFMTGGKLEKAVDEIMPLFDQPELLLKAANERFTLQLTRADLEIKSPGEDGTIIVTPATREQVHELLMERGRAFLRSELTRLEQYVLIQIFDQSWKDHLYAMDILKSGIGLTAFAELDPRVQYKMEGLRYFQEMMAGVRDKVTDLIFHASVAGQVVQRNMYRETAAVHEEPGSYGVGESLAATATATTRAVPQTEMQQAAAKPQGEATKVKQLVRETAKVGRNDPCPCGSGKKYKKCHGANAA